VLTIRERLFKLGYWVHSAG